MDQDELKNELRVTFLDEFRDVLDTLEEGFLRFENEDDKNSVINELFRSFHNAKGSSKAVGFVDLANVSHQCENILTRMRSGELSQTPEIMDCLFSSIDIMRNYAEELQIDFNADASALHELSQKIEGAVKGSDSVDSNVMCGVQQANPSGSENLDSSQSRSSGLQLFDDVDGLRPDEKKAESGTENNKANNLIAKQGQKNPKETVKTKQEGGVVEASIKIPISRIDQLLDLFGEQVILQSSFDHILHKDLEQQRDFISKTTDTLKKITRDLQHTMVNLRMVPVKPLFLRLERVARDVARLSGKQLNFVKKGYDCEVDKTIVDALIDPLTHMVRNAVDHGLETTEGRNDAGKEVVGTVTMSAIRNGDSFEIILEDDGRGLDREKILEKAISKGLTGEDSAHLSDSEVFNFIFSSGFSTKDQVTEISGRGVGMDVVREKLRHLKGGCQISSQKDKGTRFNIRLPLSLAMFNGTVVEVSSQKYVIPNSDFSETLCIDYEKVTRAKSNIIRIDDRVLKLIDLERILRVGNTSSVSKKSNVIDKASGHNKRNKDVAIIVFYEGQEYALIVEDIISQEQIVLKRLGPEFQKVKSSSGGTILGDGKVALVLDLNQIVSQAIFDQSKCA